VHDEPGHHGGDDHERRQGHDVLGVVDLPLVDGRDEVPVGQ
jgi:hypothetical protein